MRKILLVLFTTLIGVHVIFAQSRNEIIQSYINTNKSDLNLSDKDLSEWEISDSHIDKRNGIEFVYIRQTINGIPVQNGLANFAIKNGQITHMGNRLFPEIAKEAPSSSPSISPAEAIVSATNQLGLNSPAGLNLIEEISEHKFLYSKADISLEDIPIELMYYKSEDDKMHLIWDLSIYEKSAENWWSVSLDANSGQLIRKTNWVSKCDFGHFHEDGDISNSRITNNNNQKNINQASGAEYRVFDLPVESPNHGPRTLVTDPADSISSPFGWHDTNGIAGVEFTITRGNNVFAYEDANANNAPGFSPDGSSALHFDFPFTPNTPPSSYQAAAITNLFYMNNKMHDIWYQYGFDEASGNFQFNNYGKGGSGSDEVNAEAQDGGGTNNANFGTPPDGSNPRMQMFIWTNNVSSINLEVNSPTSIAGIYPAIEAIFGPSLNTSITSDLVLVNDGTLPNPNDACETLVNGASLNGKIAVIDRGDCLFVDKVQFAQNAGAVAVIMINNVGGNAIAMGGTSSTITIPSVMITLNNGNLIKNAMSMGTVNVTLNAPNTSGDIDGDFDNGIIAHEYGHGISNRLTGGRFASGCLSSAEQMGEGWSDWFGLMLTIDPSDQGSDVRGIGTFAIDQPVNGNGIRPAPYSTDFNVNNFTYGSTNSTSISQPHGLGFVYATALWDMTWALINQYGGTPDPDLYNGTGGNNIAMNLVITSLKLQPCDPGMLDGRDAILAADQLLYNGAHRCLIWNVFANRGFGFSASQGSANSRFDQVEAFDLPPFCQLATQAPDADFIFNPTVSSCESLVSFTDMSLNTPQNWVWNFGDGTVDSTFNPSHIYSAPGTYSVKMVVSNTIGSDSITKTVVIEQPGAPMVSDKEVCNTIPIVNLAVPNATGNVEWFDSGLNLLRNGVTYSHPVSTDELILVRYNESSSGSVCVSPFDSVYISVLESDFNYSQNGSTFNFNDASSNASSWLWNFGDGSSSTQQNPSHTYLANGNFTVSLAINGTSCSSEELVNVVSGIDQAVFGEFKLYPNPANDFLTLLFSEPVNNHLNLSIETVQGEVLEKMHISKGKQSLRIDVKNYAPAMYLLRINGRNTQSVLKFSIEN